MQFPKFCNCCSVATIVWVLRGGDLRGTTRILFLNWMIALDLAGGGTAMPRTGTLRRPRPKKQCQKQTKHTDLLRPHLTPPAKKARPREPPGSRQPQTGP